jgi:DNA-directed RNA polymerase subunit L
MNTPMNTPSDMSPYAQVPHNSPDTPIARRNQDTSIKVGQFKEEGDTITFTLSGVDFSYANALRRIILADIPIVVFETTPHDKNKCNMIINTTRLNNEILKQRLSCIPICISDLEIDLKNYLLEVDVENKTDTTIIVTTKDFMVKNVSTNTYLEDNDVRKIFPPYIPPTGKGEYFIEFARLRPKMSDEIPGERLKFTCEFSIATARDDSMFNVTGTCSYGFTPNREEMVKQLGLRRAKWEEEGKTEAEVDFESKNWNLLEGLRYVTKNSFDFILQTIGIYENTDIMFKACDILIKKINIQRQLLDTDEMEIKASKNTLENSYDIILKNEDYTVGNILNSELYETFYLEHEMLSYVGFKKMHPHDDDSIIRVAFNQPNAGKSNVKEILTTVMVDAIKKIERIRFIFSESRYGVLLREKLTKSTFL